MDLLARAESLGIRLTPKERAAFADLTGGKGKMSVTEYEDFVRSRTFFTNEQLTLHNIRESVHNESYSALFTGLPREYARAPGELTFLREVGEVNSTTSLLRPPPSSALS